jgi:hypothetical protein
MAPFSMADFGLGNVVSGTRQRRKAAGIVANQIFVVFLKYDPMRMSRTVGGVTV